VKKSYQTYWRENLKRWPAYCGAQRHVFLTNERKLEKSGIFFESGGKRRIHAPEIVGGRRVKLTKGKRRLSMPGWGDPDVVKKSTVLLCFAQVLRERGERGSAASQWWKKEKEFCSKEKLRESSFKAGIKRCTRWVKQIQGLIGMSLRAFINP